MQFKHTSYNSTNFQMKQYILSTTPVLAYPYTFSYADVPLVKSTRIYGGPIILRICGGPRHFFPVTHTCTFYAWKVIRKR